MMHRREFSQSLGVAAVALGVAPLAMAQNRPPEDGADYVSLDKALPTEPKGKVEVIEFFWYNCPHCNNFEPILEAWVQKLPRDVVFRRAPVAFRDTFVPQQRLYYTLEAMGKIDTLHKKVFHAIHNERQTLDNQEQIATWVEKQGVDKKKFLDLYNSFATNGKTARAKQLQDQYKISGVPALAIGGRYVTDGAMAQGMPRALQVTEFLMEKVRRS